MYQKIHDIYIFGLLVKSRFYELKKIKSNDNDYDENINKLSKYLQLFAKIKIDNQDLITVYDDFKQEIQKVNNNILEDPEAF